MEPTMHPDVGPNHYARGRLLYEQNRFELARREFHAAAAFESDDAESLAWLALSLIHLGRFSEAEEAARGSLAREADLPFGHYALAYALLNQQRQSEATIEARESVRLAPESGDCRLLLANLAKVRHDWSSMLAHAADAVAINPTDVRALHFQAEATVQLNQPESAIPILRLALEQAPEVAELHFTLGRALLRTGREREAISFLREAVRLEPNSEQFRLVFAESLRSRNSVYRFLLTAAIRSPRKRAVRARLLAAAFIAYLALVYEGISAPIEGLPWIAGLMAPGLALLTWPQIRVAVFDVFLQFDPVGRHILSRRMKITAWLVSAMLVVAIVGFLLAIIEPSILIAATPLASTSPWLLFLALSERKASLRAVRMASLMPCAVTSSLACIGAAWVHAGGPVMFAEYVLILLLISAGLYFLGSIRGWPGRHATRPSDGRATRDP